MTRTAVIVGSGRSVWADLDALGPVVEPSDRVHFSINDMICLPGAPRPDHGVSHHPDKLVHWAALRRETVTTHSSAVGPGIDHAWPQFREGRSGSSALLATRIALELGFESVIVVGVPLDAGGYVWSRPAAAGNRNFLRYRLGWDDQQAILRGRVTAVSGYLAELLGRPAPAMREAVSA